jgi:hypothetical protein
VQRSSVRELAEAVGPRYQRATKGETSRLLDEFCAVTCYHRAYARALLRGDARAGSGLQRRGRPRQYGRLEVALLRACWEIADGI